MELRISLKYPLLPRLNQSLLFFVPELQKSANQGSLSHASKSPEIDYKGTGLAVSHHAPGGNGIDKLVDDFFQSDKLSFEGLTDLVQLGGGMCVMVHNNLKIAVQT
jgi:hypothetical protein